MWITNPNVVRRKIALLFSKKQIEQRTRVAMLRAGLHLPPEQAVLQGDRYWNKMNRFGGRANIIEHWRLSALKRRRAAIGAVAGVGAAATGGYLARRRTS